MDPKQILDYSLEGVKWAGVVLSVGYPTLILIGPTISSVLSRKIRSQKELESVIKEESKKLGLEGVKGVYVDSFSTSVSSAAYIAEDGTPVVRTNRLFASRSLVKHELYHHRRGHVKMKFQSKLSKRLYYFLIGEPQDCLYQLTGIKL